MKRERDVHFAQGSGRSSHLGCASFPLLAARAGLSLSVFLYRREGWLGGLMPFHSLKLGVMNLAQCLRVFGCF